MEKKLNNVAVGDIIAVPNQPCDRVRGIVRYLYTLGIVREVYKAKAGIAVVVDTHDIHERGKTPGRKFLVEVCKSKEWFGLSLVRAMRGLEKFYPEECHEKTEA